MSRDLSYNGGAMTAHYRKMKRYIAEDRASAKAFQATLTPAIKKVQKQRDNALIAANTYFSDNAVKGFLTTDEQKAEYKALRTKYDELCAVVKQMVSDNNTAQ